MRLLKFKYFLIINSRCCSVNLILFWRVAFVLSLILFAIPCDNAAEIFGGGSQAEGTCQQSAVECGATVELRADVNEWTAVIRTCEQSADECGATVELRSGVMNEPEWTYAIMKILPGWMLRDYLLYLNETTRQLYEINLNTIILLI